MREESCIPTPRIGNWNPIYWAKNVSPNDQKSGCTENENFPLYMEWWSPLLARTHSKSIGCRILNLRCVWLNDLQLLFRCPSKISCAVPWKDSGTHPIQVILGWSDAPMPFCSMVLVHCSVIIHCHVWPKCNMCILSVFHIWMQGDILNSAAIFICCCKGNSKLILVCYSCLESMGEEI